MKQRRLSVALTSALLLALPGAHAEPAETPNQQVTLTGPGMQMAIDLSRFVDPAHPDDDTVARVIGGLVRDVRHEELLAGVLANPQWRALHDDLNARISMFGSGDITSASHKEPWLPHIGGDGNHVLFIGYKTAQQSINGGTGHNLGIIVGDGGARLNLALAKLEVVLGGPGNDILVGGGRSTVMLDAGPGNDIVIGGAANDILSGGDGDDMVDGGAGNDIMRGGNGRDNLMGGPGDDNLAGGADHDRLTGGSGNDALVGDGGDDTIEGGEGTDMAAYHGPLAEYRILRLEAHAWRVADSRFGRDGSDQLRDIERLHFADWWWVPIDGQAPIPVDDTILFREQSEPIQSYRDQSLANARLIRAPRLLVNDLSPSGKDLATRALLDNKDHEVPRDTWAQVDGGQALLTATGDVIFRGGSPVKKMSFRYRIADAAGHRGAPAARAGSSAAQEMWATVRLVGIAPVAATSNRRECDQDCTLDPGETELVLTGTQSSNGTGNDLPNTLIGNTGDNTLDGGRGADVMRGGPGQDTYFVDDAGDQVVELRNEGIDTVVSSVENYSLPADVENLRLLPGVHDAYGNDIDNNLRGNDLDNRLEGHAGNDILDGGSGADRLIGGPGDDTFVVDDPGDDVIELPAEGSTDTVLTEISYRLPPNVENLALTGRADIDGSGNDLDNRISGNAGANTLKGGAGNDLLEGGAGNDTLDGGPGNNVYVLSQRCGHDTVVEYDPTPGYADTLRLPPLKPEAFWFWRQANDLNIAIDSKNWVTLSDWYLTPPHRVERIEAGNYILVPEGAETLARAMTDLPRPPDGKAALPDELKSRLGHLIDETWRKEFKPVSGPTSK